LLVEGGSRLTAELLQRDLVDRVHWFRAASVIGGDGIPAAAAFGVEQVADARRFERIAVELVGPDILETYRRGP